MERPCVSTFFFIPNKHPPRSPILISIKPWGFKGTPKLWKVHMSYSQDHGPHLVISYITAPSILG